MPFSDTSTNTVTATIPNLGTTSSPVVSPDGKRLYVLNYVCGGCNEIIQVIDTVTNTQLTTFDSNGTRRAPCNLRRRILPWPTSSARCT